MPDVSVDNDPVSITLDQGESFTVPDGETHRVTIVSDVDGSLSINGVGVAGSQSGDRTNGSVAFTTVLVGGDRVDVLNGQGAVGGAHIGGFVV